MITNAYVSNLLENGFELVLEENGRTRKINVPYEHIDVQIGNVYVSGVLNDGYELTIELDINGKKRTKIIKLNS